MYYCILNTITEEANSKIINETERYVVDGINSGPLLFKFLMSVITIDMRATITNLRMGLTNLDSYIAVIKYDIDKFNLYVKEKRKKLRKRGESSQDILINLFKACEIVSDQTLNNWLIRKKENYEEGAEVTPDTLMLDALNRYQSLKDEGKWKSTSPEDTGIIALTMQIEEMQKFLKGTSLRFKSKRNARKKDQEKNETNKPSKKNKKKKFDKSRFRREFEVWKKNPPGLNEPKELFWKGKKYFYCDEDQDWG